MYLCVWFSLLTIELVNLRPSPNFFSFVKLRLIFRSLSDPLCFVWWILLQCRWYCVTLSPSRLRLFYMTPLLKIFVKNIFCFFIFLWRFFILFSHNLTQDKSFWLAQNDKTKTTKLKKNAGKWFFVCSCYT